MTGFPVSDRVLGFRPGVGFRPGPISGSRTGTSWFLTGNRHCGPAGAGAVHNSPGTFVRQTEFRTPQAPPAYLAKMAKAMDAGMSLRITYWGDAAAAMTWLDPPSCGLQACDAGGVAELRDFRVTPGRPHRGRTCLTVLLCVGSVVLAAAIWRLGSSRAGDARPGGSRCGVPIRGRQPRSQIT